MKTLPVIFILFLCPLFLCQAQYIELHTPNGNIVSAKIYAEWTDELIIIKSEIDSDLVPHVTILDSASHTYNCHSYAWNMTEGGPICSLEYNPNIVPYLDTNNGGDGSYNEVSESLAEKIIYYKNNVINEDKIVHSAIKAPNNPGMFISKWGTDGPLVLHAPEDVPKDYHKGTQLRYFKKSSNLIFGHYVVCTGGNQFFFNSTSTVTWTISDPSPFSFSPTSSSVKSAT